MRKILLVSAAISLSGCSFLGLGGGGQYGNSYQNSYAPAPQCQTGQCYSRFNLEGGIGVSSMVDGRAVTASQSASPNLGNFSMRTMYDPAYRAELGGSYALNPNTKLTAIGHFEEAKSAGAADWGNTGPLGAGPVFRGSLSDYKSYGGEVGLRHYFRPQSAPAVRSIRPYLEARVGASHVDAITIQNAQLGGVAFNGGEVAFYDDSWVASATGLVGIETPLTRYSTIALETGLRYRGDLDADNSDIAGPAAFLDDANDGGSALSVPIMVRGRYRF